MNSALQQVFDEVLNCNFRLLSNFYQFSKAREAVREAEKALVGRIGCKVVTLREEIDALNQELTELGRLQESLGDSRSVLVYHISTVYS